MAESNGVTALDAQLEQLRAANSLAARCPHLAGRFDPLMDDPFPDLVSIREDAPAYYDERHGAWFITRHEDILKIFHDPIGFSNVGAVEMRIPLPPALALEVGEDYTFPIQGHLQTIDPPEHTRLRKLLQKAFTAGTIARKEGEVGALVNGLVDKFIDDGEVELVRSFTSPIPVNVIAMVLGTEQDYDTQFRDWVEAAFMLAGSSSMPEDKATIYWGRLIECDRWVRELIAERRVNPSDDLTTAMIQAESDDGSPSLSDEEIVQSFIGILGAGSDTTSVLIAESLHQLLSVPERWRQVVADPTLIPKVVEEGLRLRCPVRGLNRQTTCEVELGGVKIPAGEHVYAMISAANRDPAVFGHPEEFDLARGDVREHLGLGKWTHFCIGAVLARMEARIALETLVERIPSMRLASDQGDLRYDVNLMVPMLHKLDVVWD